MKHTPFLRACLPARLSGRQAGRATAAALAVLALSGCATVTTLAEHHSLEVSTKMSSSIFLDPVATNQQTVFVQVHNTTDKGSIGLTPALDAAIQAKGWTLVNDPAQAEVVLQVNVLQAGKIKKSALQAALSGGYGGVLGSAALGGGIAALAGANGYGVGGAALGLGAADYVGGLLVKDVTYSVITDVRVLQHGANGQTFTVQHNTGINSNAGGSQTQQQTTGAAILGQLLGTGSVQSNGASSNVQSNTSQSYTTQSQYMIHQTRVISSADQANLDWKEALPKIRQGLVNTLSGLF